MSEIGKNYLSLSSVTLNYSGVCWAGNHVQAKQQTVFQTIVSVLKLKLRSKPKQLQANIYCVRTFLRSSVRGTLGRKMFLKELSWNWITFLFKKYNCISFKVIFQVNNTHRSLNNTLKWHTLLYRVLSGNWFLCCKHQTCIQRSQELRGQTSLSVAFCTVIPENW